MRILKILLISLVIAWGLLALAVRSATPWLGEYREQIAALASERLGVPVSIGGVEARWHGLQPLLRLNYVEVGHPQSRVSATRVDLDLMPLDLLRGRLADALRITVEGLRLTVIREPAGQIHLRGVKTEPLAIADARQAVVPGHLRLVNTRILWVDRKTGRSPLPIDAVNIVVERDDAIGLRATLKTPAGGAEFWARLQGNLLGTEWSGDSYLRIDRLDVAQLLAAEIPARYGVKSARVDLQAWTHWTGAAPEHSQGRLALTGIELAPPDGTPLTMERLGGQFSLNHGANGLRLGIHELDVAMAGHRWPDNDVALSIETHPDGMRRIELAADYLRLEDVRAILAVHPPRADLHQALATTKPVGEVHDLRVSAQLGGDKPRWRLKAGFAGLESQPWEKLPGVRNLRGELAGNQDVLAVTLASEDAEVLFSELFRDPLAFKRIEGRVDVQRNGQTWRLLSDNLIADSPHLSTRSRLQIEQRLGESLFVDLQTDFRDGDAAFASRYYPVGIMSDELVAWLDRSIGAGRVIDGTALLYGPIDDFAFEKTRSGVFQVLFRTDDVELSYRESWPQLDRLDALVNFHGNQLDIRANEGQIYDSRVEQVSAAIRSLDPPSPIAIKGVVTGPLNNLVRLASEPALQDRFGLFAAELQASGDSRLDLDFAIPIGTDAPAVLDGRLKMEGNRLALPDRNFALSGIVGQLDFSLDGLRANDIRAKLLGQTIRVDVLPLKSGTTRVRGRGRFNIDDLDKVVDGLPEGLAQGNAALVIDLDIPKNPSAGRGVELAIRSDLTGVAVDLPAPLGKSAASKRELDVRIPLTGKTMSSGSLRFGKELSAAFSRGGKRIAVQLGGAQAAPHARSGIHIGGRLHELDLAAWLAVLGDLPRMDARALTVDLSIDRANAGDVTLGQLALDARREAQAWRGQLRADNFTGRFAIPTDNSRAPIEVELDRLVLTLPVDDAGASPEPDVSAGPDPSTLRGMKLRIADLRVNDARLGKATLSARPATNGLTLEQASLNDGQLTLNANGYWIRDGATYRSSITGKTETDDLGQLLADLGYTRQFSDASANSDFELRWPGNPAQFHRATLQGNVAIDIGKGRLIELDPGVTRVVGLLNLNALTRRLRLDFSDFYKKGYSFDNIAGNFRFEHGLATTNDLSMVGPTGRIDIKGNADLSNETLDQKVAVTPNFDATLPIAGTLAGGPVAGIAVLLAQQVMDKQVDDINRFDYSITGFWDQPEVKQLDSGGTLSKLFKPFRGGSESGEEEDGAKPPVTDSTADDTPETPADDETERDNAMAGSAASETRAETVFDDDPSDAKKKSDGPIRSIIDFFKSGEPYGNDIPGQ